MTGGEKTECTLSRRFFLGASVTSVAGLIASQRASPASIVKDDPNLPPYGSGTLPPDIRARTVRDVNGLNVNVLESGFQDSGRSLVLLLHGFPELAYGWRKVMLPLAAAGYHVVAPDQRGYGAHLLASPARSRKTVQCPRFSTPLSRWTRSWSPDRKLAFNGKGWGQ